jgi:uncharacterized coiled-coil protein SlyX
MTNSAHISTRDDPHAQERAARSLPLLLHSMSVFREIFEIIFANRDISTVVEVGVESGQASSLYAELGASTVYCIDPSPSDELRANLAGHDALNLVEKPSPEALADLPPADLYVLDGDHNYAVVHQEVSWIQRHAPDAVILLHDVLWPCARRDLYYQPSPIPASDQHPASADGPTVWHDELTPAGLVGLGAFTMAHHAGGERNGVLTAVEDAIAQSGDDWQLCVVPAVFGMGVLLRRAVPGSAEIIKAIQPYCDSHLIATMENNRLALYTRVLQQQYDAAAQADNTDRLAETVAGQRKEIDRLRADMDAAVARHAREVEALRQEVDRLRALLNRQFRPRIAAKLNELGRAASTQLRKHP